MCRKTAATRPFADHDAGDAPILLAAQSQIRGEFRSNQGLDPQDGSVSKGIEHATEVAKFLRENVVQGKKMDGEEAKYSTLNKFSQGARLGLERRLTSDVQSYEFTNTPSEAIMKA